MARILPLLMLGLLFAGSDTLASDEEREISLSLPPASLAQWYPPRNKRQLWLHTMFALRREYQAVNEYIVLERPALAKKWLARFDKHYRSIGKMVPEWRDELDLEQLDRLGARLRAGDLKEAAKAARKLAMSCRSCHRDYRVVTALLYRAPDFSSITVEDSESLEEEEMDKVMERLTTLLNRIKIAAGDGRREVATESLSDLRRRLDDLGESCGQCHRDEAPRERILGQAYAQAGEVLEQALAHDDGAATAKAIGELAVGVCARCHGVHRIQSDARELLIEQGE